MFFQKHGEYDKFITVFIITNWNYFEYIEADEQSSSLFRFAPS